MNATDSKLTNRLYHEGESKEQKKCAWNIMRNRLRNKHWLWCEGEERHRYCPRSFPCSPQNDPIKQRSRRGERQSVRDLVGPRRSAAQYGHGQIKWKRSQLRDIGRRYEMGSRDVADCVPPHRPIVADKLIVDNGRECHANRDERHQ